VRFVIWYISALAAVVLGGYLLWTDYRIKNDGVITNGIIQSRVMGRPRWIYSFQTANHQMYFGESRAEHHLGDKPKVSYLPDNAETSRDLGDDFWYWTGILLFVVGAALYARGIVVARQSTKQQNPSARAVTEPS